MPTVYVLQSLKDEKTYVGSTNNFEKRLLLHTSGRVKSTKNRIPFKVLFTEEFETLKRGNKTRIVLQIRCGKKKTETIL